LPNNHKKAGFIFFIKLKKNSSLSKINFYTYAKCGVWGFKK